MAAARHVAGVRENHYIGLAIVLVRAPNADVVVVVVAASDTKPGQPAS
jgi:hypothetical protein